MEPCEKLVEKHLALEQHDDDDHDDFLLIHL
jgi:hypothetical protein